MTIENRDLAEALNELRSKASELGDLRAKVAKLGDVDGRLAELKAQSDEIERKINHATTDFGGTGESFELVGSRRERKAFAAWAKTGDRAAMAQLEAKAIDADFATNSTAGGVAIPEVIASEVLRKVRDLSPMRRLVRVTQVSSPNYERLVDVNGVSSGWAAEATTRSETGTPAIQRVQFTHGELYAVPKASNWALNDIMFNVEGWLTDAVAEEFAVQEGAAIISGNGTNKPTGFLAGTPVATGDDDALSPPRAFGTLQYIPTGAAAGFQNDRLTSPAGDPTGVFYDTWAALKARYRERATWIMNSSTLATVMKFRNADGDRLVRDSLKVGEPMAILGRPVTVMEGMPNIGANTFPIAFGDFMAGYELIDITGLTAIRDDVTSKGNTLFYVARRLGGKVTNDDAIKVIKAAAS